MDPHLPLTSATTNCVHINSPPPSPYAEEDQPAMATPPNPSPFFLLAFFLLLPIPSQSRQLYINNVQNDCYSSHSSSALGYSCSSSSSDPPSCPSFLTFRSQTNYQSPAQIARLLNADPLSIVRINGVPEPDPFPLHSLVLVPISCFCTGGEFYQANASYTLRSSEDTYLVTANNTYQGLSTCQALMAQNPSHDSRALGPNMKIDVPLRCACPSRDQTAAGAKFLLSYLVTWRDDINKISARFRVRPEDVLDANSLNSTSTIFPFTTILVPLRAEPSPADLISPPPPPPPPSITENSNGGGKDSGSGHKLIIAGTATAAVVLVILGFFAAWFLFLRRRRHQKDEEKPIFSQPSLNEKIRNAMLGSLTAYKFDDLNKATNSFSEENRINFSSVYRATINSDIAAVKRTKEDCQNEISILNQINHSNIIRLSGFCHNNTDNFLVYEFAENGSLGDWLHKSSPKNIHAHHLDWITRARIACDVADALNYLHNCTTPPVVHRNLKSSNILLDREFKGKLGNFAMARPSEFGGGPAELTAHVIGTQGYLAPEYLEHGLVSTKLDVFAFGVVLIEILTGKGATDDNKDHRLASEVSGVLAGEDVREKMKKFMDPRLGEEYPFSLAFAMAQLAERCVKEDYNLRPSAGELLLALTAIYSSSVDWDPVDLSQSDSADDL